MNTGTEYIEVMMHFTPLDEEHCGMVEAILMDIGYESFMVSEAAICQDGGSDGNAQEPVLLAYIEKEKYDARKLKLALSSLDFDITTSSNLITPQNWNATWEEDFKPVIVDKTVTIKGTHHKNLPRTRFNITIRPDMAFGTGHHDTTYMVMEAMLKHENDIKGHMVMDMGCGTAVLGILAAKMGAFHVYGIDIDAVAAQSAFDNARMNRVGKKVETYCGDASLLQMGKYDVLLANIHRNIILEDLPTYVRSLRVPGVRNFTDNPDEGPISAKGGLLILSGFYDSDVDDILASAMNLGLHLEERLSRNGWACLVLRKV